MRYMGMHVTVDDRFPKGRVGLVADQRLQAVIVMQPWYKRFLRSLDRIGARLANIRW